MALPVANNYWICLCVSPKRTRSLSTNANPSFMFVATSLLISPLLPNWFWNSLPRMILKYNRYQSHRFSAERTEAKSNANMLNNQCCFSACEITWHTALFAWRLHSIEPSCVSVILAWVSRYAGASPPQSLRSRSFMVGDQNCRKFAHKKTHVTDERNDHNEG